MADNESYNVDTHIKIDRPTSDLGASCIIMDHANVVADFAADNSAIKTQSALYDLWITDLSVVSDTDPTAEVAVQAIPFKVAIYDTTDSQYRWICIGCIPNCCHFSFNTPIKIQAGHGFRTVLYLGGATDLTMVCIANGYEIPV